MKSFRIFILILFASFAFYRPVHADVIDTVVIQSGKQRHSFNVEIADDEEKRSRGLMFREELAYDAGMLFVFRRPQIEYFWMKNTYIPLDIIFIALDGKIVKIHRNARPHDLTAISSVVPVAAVLEITGGGTGKRGIDVGDTVLSPKFRIK